MSAARFALVAAAFGLVAVAARAGTTPPITVSPSHLSIKPGTQVTLTVTTLANGSSEQLNLAVSGLPTPVAGTFNPATIQMGQSSTLTLAADQHAAGGSWTYAVEALGQNNSPTNYSGSASVTVDNGSSGCPAGTTDNNGYCVPVGTGCNSAGFSSIWALLAAVGVLFAFQARRAARNER
jgi:hypothetical protein